MKSLLKSDLVNIWDVQAKLDEIINIVKDLKKKNRKVIVVRQVRGKRNRMTMAWIGKIANL